MSATDELIDSGLQYCTEHHGVIECDRAGERCDFADESDPQHRCDQCAGNGYLPDGPEDFLECDQCAGTGITPCRPTPLLYEKATS